MVNRCVAAGCSNTASNEISLFRFPKDPTLRRKWIAKVRGNRVGWLGPSKSGGYLCSQHFSADCFLTGSSASKRRLVKGAIPSIFDSSSPSTRSESTTPTDFAVPVFTPVTMGSMTMSMIVHQPQLTQIELHQQPEAGPSTEQHAACRESTVQTRSVTVQCQLNKKMVNKGTNTLVKCMVDTAVQTVFPMHAMSEPVIHSGREEIVEEMEVRSGEGSGEEYGAEGGVDSEEEYEAQGGNSSSYVPSSSEASVSTGTESLDEVVEENVCKDQNYIVFWTCLAALFQLVRCVSCGEHVKVVRRMVCGTLLRVYLACTACNRQSRWESQACGVSGVPLGNIMLSTAILTAGALPSKVLRVLRQMSVAVYSDRTYFRHQRNLVMPAIRRVWEEQQRWMIATLQTEDRPLVFGGDGRADSPGHSAKYGSYVLMELEANAVIDVQLVQSNEVGGSHAMEKEGLIRSVAFLENNGLYMATLVTDRHSSIRKWMRDQMPDVLHLFDVWHIAKGLKKKLLVLSNNRGCGIIHAWIPSIINHLYWCAVSTASSETATIQAKWRSLLNHTHNVHVHSDQHFPHCLHGPLEGREAEKEWIPHGSEASTKLEAIILNQHLLKDLSQLSGREQTSTVEGFHSVLNHFAPKMYGFSYNGMYSRVVLAALHHNENSQRVHLKTKAGVHRYSIQFPKWKKGGYTVKKILAKPSYEYAAEIMTDVMEQCILRKQEQGKGLVLPPQPPVLCHSHPRPTKEEAVCKHVTRFSKD